MNATRILAICTLALLCGVAHPAAARPGPDEQPWQDYEVLVRRNIFSRNRGRPIPGTDEPERREAPQPEQFMFLRGVLRTNGEFVALLEDMGSGQVLRVRQGDAVLAGEVGKVWLDGVDYVRDGETITIAVGGNLLRGAAAAAVASVSAAASAPEVSRDAADVLERLRQRRMREFGQ